MCFDYQSTLYKIFVFSLLCPIFLLILGIILLLGLWGDKIQDDDIMVDPDDS